MQFQRLIGWSKPLAHALSIRFEVQSAMRNALRDELAVGDREVVALVGEGAGKQVIDLMRERLEAVNLNVASVRLQYPDYFRAVETRHLTSIALRIDRLTYRELVDKALISQDICDDLMSGLGVRAGSLGVQPKLDLGLQPDILVRKVPFLAELSSDRINAITSMLKSRFTLPGEMVISKGETGSAMYFISSGSVLVELEDQNVQLGSGDFFGEIALLVEVARTANVRSLGFCQLLKLERRDFLPFLNANADLKTRKAVVAAVRLAQTSDKG